MQRPWGGLVYLWSWSLPSSCLVPDPEVPEHCLFLESFVSGSHSHPARPSSPEPIAFWRGHYPETPVHRWPNGTQPRRQASAWFSQSDPGPPAILSSSREDIHIGFRDLVPQRVVIKMNSVKGFELLSWKALRGHQCLLTSASGGKVPFGMPGELLLPRGEREKLTSGLELKWWEGCL